MWVVKYLDADGQTWQDGLTTSSQQHALDLQQWLQGIGWTARVDLFTPATGREPVAAGMPATAWDGLLSDGPRLSAASCVPL